MPPNVAELVMSQQQGTHSNISTFFSIGSTGTDTAGSITMARGGGFSTMYGQTGLN